MQSIILLFALMLNGTNASAFQSQEDYEEWVIKVQNRDHTSSCEVIDNGPTRCEELLGYSKQDIAIQGHKNLVETQINLNGTNLNSCVEFFLIRDEPSFSIYWFDKTRLTLKGSILGAAPGKIHNYNTDEGNGDFNIYLFTVFGPPDVFEPNFAPPDGFKQVTIYNAKTLKYGSSKGDPVSYTINYARHHFAEGGNAAPSLANRVYFIDFTISTTRTNNEADP